MTRLETYKILSKKVDCHIRIIEYCKTKENKKLAVYYYERIKDQIENYYRFEKITNDANNYFMNRLIKNIEWFNKK